MAPTTSYPYLVAEMSRTPVPATVAAVTHVLAPDLGRRR
jgi:hypothetical protein